LHIGQIPVLARCHNAAILLILFDRINLSNLRKDERWCSRASMVSLPKRPVPSDDNLLAAIDCIHPIHVIAVVGCVMAIDLPVCCIGSLAHGEEISVLTSISGREFVT
jgi:hypothetical protein